MVLVQHDRNFAVARAEHNLDVQTNQCAQALFGSGIPRTGLMTRSLRDVHGVVHDLEQDFVFALEVVVEAAFAQLEGGGDIVHGRGIVSALLEQAGGGAQNFLPGIDYGFACHRVPW